ncbi:hypothetical protein LJB42_000120 [Komagataella kurtzmanii]|nr:hypothetical protein LJB42_000120 [Komagataella kurtzmanii]
MPVFEAPAVYVQNAYNTLNNYMIHHMYLSNLIDFHHSNGNVIPLESPTVGFHVRRDNNDKQRIVNVFDHNGQLRYTFERLSSLNPVWSMFDSSRREIATVRVGFFSRSIDFHNKPGVLQHREIKTVSNWRQGTLDYINLQGNMLAWTKNSKFLEIITNVDDNDEEIRVRAARVRLMRQWKFDFELVVDESRVDAEIALGTGFVSMMTRWGVGDLTETRGPTPIVAPALHTQSKSEPKSETTNGNTNNSSSPNSITLVVNDDEIIIEH